MDYLSIHTMDLHHQISYKEYKRLLYKFNKKQSKEVYIGADEIKIKGVDNIVLRSRPFPRGNDIYTKYDMSIRVNAGRLISDSEHLMLVWSQRNIELFKKKQNRVLANKLGLEGKNADVSDWYLKRVDCGIDIVIPPDAYMSKSEYIMYLHDIFKYFDGEYEYYPFSGYNTDEARRETLYLRHKEKECRYNIYDKQRELEKKGKILSGKELDEVSNVIRVEKQIEDIKIINPRGQKRFSILENEGAGEKILKKIRKELETIFPNNIGYIIFYELNNNPGTKRYFFSDLIGNTLSNRRVVRYKAAFGTMKLYKEKGRSPRYKARITLHDEDGNTFRTTVPAKVEDSLEVGERKVYQTIYKNARKNFYSKTQIDAKKRVVQYYIDELEAYRIDVSDSNTSLLKDSDMQIEKGQKYIAD